MKFTGLAVRYVSRALMFCKLKTYFTLIEELLKISRCRDVGGEWNQALGMNNLKYTMFETCIYDLEGLANGFRLILILQHIVW